MITRQDAIQDLQGTYCVYCAELKTYGSCCGENHFVEFGELYEDDQEELIKEYLRK
jgi:hypothetical protein